MALLSVVRCWYPRDGHSIQEIARRIGLPRNTIRHSLEFVSWKDRKTVMPALKAIYRAQDAEAGMKALEAFEAGYWGQRYPAIALSWRRNWTHVVPFFAFPESVRRIIYTTDAIEALNSKLRRAVRTRGHFPSDEAAMKLLYLVLNHAAEEWKRPPREWIEAKTHMWTAPTLQEPF